MLKSLFFLFFIDFASSLCFLLHVLQFFIAFRWCLLVFIGFHGFPYNQWNNDRKSIVEYNNNERNGLEQRCQIIGIKWNKWARTSWNGMKISGITTDGIEWTEDRMERDAVEWC